MAIEPSTAARAYLDTLKAVDNARAGGTSEAMQAGFEGLVQQAAKTIESTAGSAEVAMTQSALGQADLVDVVTAVAAAEATLETVITVRDQVIKAYQEILKMPI